MYTATNGIAANGLRERWTSPSRSGLRLIISPIEYRHLRTFGRVRIVSGVVLIGLGTLTYGWASWFLAGAAANLSFGYWELTIASDSEQI
jgi:hypothetical protein